MLVVSDGGCRVLGARGELGGGEVRLWCCVRRIAGGRGIRDHGVGKEEWRTRRPVLLHRNRGTTVWDPHLHIG